MTKPSEAAVSAVQDALGCKRHQFSVDTHGPGFSRCLKDSHGARPWTERGCPVAVAAADAAAPWIVMDTLMDAAEEVASIHNGYPNHAQIRSLMSIRRWLRKRAVEVATGG